ncbi:MAG: IS630 family transposase [Mucilaginibacter sp.]|jgi:transposase|uniref:IS630 family transposase n=1 Tax=Mucilaginibacter sp. TaxID=1882438 RepID=UPI0035696A2E
MFRHNIPKVTVNQLRRLFIANAKFNKVAAARDLGIARFTVKRYVSEFEAIKEQFPEKLRDFNFFMPVVIPGRPRKELYKELLEMLPDLIMKQQGPKLKAAQIWQEYKKKCPDGYSYSPFKDYFFRWCNDHDISLISVKRIENFPEEDLDTLKKWRASNDHQHWQIAVVLDAANTRKSLLKTGQKVDCCFRTILRWLDIYKRHGLKGFERSYNVNEVIVKSVKEKMDNLIHLIAQSPKNFGLQRVSWTTVDLAAVYTQEYGCKMSQASVSKYLIKQGIRFRRAREVLTSPDPLFKEKFLAIQTILENLTAKEKFFSIDEYGPAAVKPKGGRAISLKGTRPWFPTVKKSRGCFVMTAALELSENQVTHFYSPKKDTGEMIKLIDLLIERYRDQDKLYLSWDAASWHASKALLAYVNQINTDVYRLEHRTPLIGIAPLPSCAQFLNVIESVFSGMSKSVIHNSDYDSLDDCKKAIDQYFDKRNQFYKKYPKKAGNIIWGKERVKPVFDKGNICKYPSGR